MDGQTETKGGGELGNQPVLTSDLPEAFDLLLLNLSLSIEQRLRRHSDALDLVEALKKAGEQLSRT